MMLQTQMRFDRGDRGRLAAIVSIVLALHGLAALHLYRQGLAFPATAVSREIPVTIRIVTAIQVPRSSAASVRPSPTPMPPTASAAPLDESGAEPNRNRVPAKHAVGRSNADVPRASESRRTEPAHKAPIPPSPNASLERHATSTAATREQETALASKSPPRYTAQTNPSTQAAGSSGLTGAEAPPPPGAPAPRSASHEPQASEGPRDDTETQPVFNAAYLHNPAPDYPPMALRRRWEGTVLLKVHVLASGGAQQVSVIATSGHESLDDAAVQAVTAWRFVPAHRAGQAIDGWVRVPVVFKAE